MRDIVFTKARQKKEIRNVLLCMVLAFVVNIASILIYDTCWSELYTQYGVMFILGCIFYGVGAVSRFFYYYYISSKR